MELSIIPEPQSQEKIKIQSGNRVDCTIVIPTSNESENLSQLLPQIHRILKPLKIEYEIIIVNEKDDSVTHQIAIQNDANFFSSLTPGYGAMLLKGFQKGNGRFIITMDPDLSHPPEFLRILWEKRHTADVLIASRYIPGAKATMPSDRLVLSRSLNIVLSRGLDLGIRDMSSGFRLYRTQAVQFQEIQSRDLDILQELLVRAYMQGYRIQEIPFDYHPIKHGSSYRRVIRFGIVYFQTLFKLWQMRNSIHSADYDARAYYSLVPPQRYWQRQRNKHIGELVSGEKKCLDVGCGSSLILGKLPPGSVGLDIQMNKLRYSKRYQKILLQGSAIILPFSDRSFPCVLSSQVIEHIPRENVLDELDRVLEPGGKLVLGTPDYGNWQWRFIEWLYKILLPQAYADEHITHYTRNELLDEFVRKRGYLLEDTRYILKGELILSFRKPMDAK